MQLYIYKINICVYCVKYLRTCYIKDTLFYETLITFMQISG